jgi:hypothetical protein
LSQFRTYIWLPPEKTFELSEEIITPVNVPPSTGTGSFHPVLILAAVAGPAMQKMRSRVIARKIRPDDMRFPTKDDWYEVIWLVDKKKVTGLSGITQ